MKKDTTYLKKDLIKYEKLNKRVLNNTFKLKALDIIYEIEQKDNIRIPVELFSKILFEKRPELIKYAPFKIIVKKLDRGENPWLKKTKLLGLYDNDKGILTIHIDLNLKYRTLPFLWLLFHEFRHHIQFHNKNILSCLDNKNREMWLNHYDYTINSVKHVFHEIDPLEIDANTFACEILNIPYPNSKFSITKKTLKRLQPKNKLNV